MKGLAVNGVGWTSAMTKDLETAGVWASDETERSAKRARAARMGDLGVMRLEFGILHKRGSGAEVIKLAKIFAGARWIQEH